MTPPHPTPAAWKKILTIEGPGWREVYELKPDGTEVLLHAFSSRKEPHDWNDATSMTEFEEMPWSEFCKRYRDNPSYRRST